MSGVFRNIDPPPPHRPASAYPPTLGAGEDTLAGWRGGVRHVTGTGSGLLGGIPKVVVQISALTLKGPL
jgi:hypothetical protein